jgi:hypothetical protein
MDTLGIWIGLNFLETFLFYYLLFGTVIDRKTLKTKDKWILFCFDQHFNNYFCMGQKICV